SELLDALDITQAPFIGHSYGGWLSTNFALRCPERVMRLSLIAPAATFTPLSWQFFVRGIMGATTRQDWVIYSMVEWMTTIRPVRGLEIVEQFRIGMKDIAQIPAGFPTVFTPEEFQSLEMPVQLIIGDHEVIYNKKPNRVVEIARQLVPHLQVTIVPNGGHAVIIDQPQATNAALIDFHGLDQNSAAAEEKQLPIHLREPA
ncbi:MAG: alpha/beta fold hydrolase, partial [Anaerolineales bacterium]